MRHRSYAGAGCPVEAALERIDGKWKGVILYHLLTDGTLRFNAIARRCNGASPRVLSRQLRELATDGLVERTVFASVPARVEYTLTPQGRSLGPALLALRDWGRALLADQNAARNRSVPTGTGPRSAL